MLHTHTHTPRHVPTRRLSLPSRPLRVHGHVPLPIEVESEEAEDMGRRMAKRLKGVEKGEKGRGVAKGEKGRGVAKGEKGKG
eukprot:2071431-Rhodomonas_salina.1